MSNIAESLDSTRKVSNKRYTENCCIQVECSKRERELAQAAQKIELLNAKMKGMKRE